MRFTAFSLAVFVFAPSILRADDAADARAIVAKSVEAIGVKADDKPLAMTCKEKGIVTGGGNKFSYESKWAFMGPDRTRSLSFGHDT
jgi:hypothetical protein